MHTHLRDELELLERIGALDARRARGRESAGPRGELHPSIGISRRARALRCREMAARWKFLIALWTVYLVWGSTYVAIKISVRTLPAFLSAGLRFLLAGAVLALILTLSGRSLRVTRKELASSALLGLALLGLGVGVVTLAETRIDSSTAAMIVGIGAAAGDPVAHPGTRAGRARDTAERARRARRARTDRDPRHRRLLQCDRPRADGRRDSLVVARLVLRPPAAAAGGWLRRDDLGDVERGALPARARLRHRRARRRRSRRLQPRVRRSLAVSRPGRHADRLHRLRLAAPQRADLEGGHTSVREPARRDRARRRPARRADHADHRHRRGADRRLGLRRRAPAGAAARRPFTCER